MQQQPIEKILESSLAAQQAGAAADAERGYRAVLERDPENLDAHYLLGCLLHTVGRNEESADHLARAAEMAPELPEVHTNYALVCRALGRIDEARQETLRAASLTENARERSLLQRRAGELRLDGDQSRPDPRTPVQRGKKFDRVQRQDPDRVTTRHSG